MSERPWDSYQDEGALTIADLMRPRGQPSATITIIASREIGHADIVEAAQAGGLIDANWGLSTVKNLRARHHRVAQLLGQGLSQTQVCEITGLSQGRLSYLLQDPSMRDLIQHYQSESQESHRDLIEQLGLLASDAASVLHDRLEDAPDHIETETLLDMLKVAADRSGVGPMSKSVSLTGRLQPADTEAAKARINQKEKMRLVQPKTLLGAPSSAPDDGQSTEAPPTAGQPHEEDSEASGGAEVGHLRDAGAKPGSVSSEGEEPQDLPKTGPEV